MTAYNKETTRSAKRYIPLVALVLLMIAWLGAPYLAHAGDLVLGELVSEAIANNPSITYSEKTYDAAVERVPQAGTLDDPMLTVGVANIETEYFAFDRIPMTSKNIGVSQKFPFFGKLGLKEAAARDEAEAASGMVDEKRLAVVRRVKDAYYDLCLVYRELELLDRQTELVRLIGETARARYSVGKGTLGESLKAEVEEARLDEMRENVKRRGRDIRAMLGNLTGRGVPVEGDPAWPGKTCAPPPRDRLVELAVASRPSIRSADAMIEKGRRSVELADLNYYPDMGVSFTYHQLDDLRTGVHQSDRVTAMLSFNLPVWRGTKLDPARREAAASVAASESAKYALVNDIAYNIDSFLSDIEREDELVKLYGDALLPLGRKELEAEMDRYSVGEMDLADLLSTVRDLFGYELGEARALIARERAVAGLEAAVGVSAADWCARMKFAGTSDKDNRDE